MTYMTKSGRVIYPFFTNQPAKMHAPTAAAEGGMFNS